MNCLLNCLLAPIHSGGITRAYSFRLESLGPIHSAWHHYRLLDCYWPRCGWLYWLLAIGSYWLLPMGQGPGPGPLGPGAWGPLGPRCRIRVATVTTYCQASYLLSGKLPTVRQAFSRYETSYLQSGKLSAVIKQATYCQAGFLPL